MNVTRLVLRILNVDSLPDGGPLVHVAQGTSFQIGRSPTMHWVLPDEMKRISGEHLRVHCRDEAYWLQDVSKNGTLVNGARLETIRRAMPGDQITIGGYLIGVELTQQAAPPRPAAEFGPSLQRRAATAGFDLGGDGFATAWSPQTQRTPGTGLLAAITRGAGLPPGSLDGQDLDRLGEDIGRCLALAVEESLALLGQRKSIRSVMIGQDVAAPLSGGNPLKEPGDARGVLFQLLAPRPGQTLGAADALAEGFADIRQHQMASTAAMQVAIVRFLEGLAPETIESAVSKGYLRSKAAKAWHRYIQEWDDRLQDTEHGMLGVFMDYFAEAYEDASLPDDDPET